MKFLSEVWRKSNYSGTNGACVQVRQVDETVELRDSKVDGVDPAITLSLEQWAVFVAEIKADAFLGASVVDVRWVDDTIELHDTRVDGAGPAMRLTPAEWRAFVDGVKADEFVAA